MKESTTSKVRTIGTLLSIVVVAVGFISWASATGLRTNQNEESIRKLSESLSVETQCRIDEDAKLKDELSTQAIATEKGITEIKVKLTNIDTKLDTNLTYLIKFYDDQQGQN